MDNSVSHMERSVGDYATQDFVQLGETMRVEEALRFIRDRPSTGQTLIYFYVVDASSALTGVLQTRALLTAQPDELLADIMIRRVIAIPETATVLDACEFFVLHKFLAFPIVDHERRIVGVVDINLFNEEVFGIPKTDTGDELFQAIGFHTFRKRAMLRRCKSSASVSRGYSSPLEQARSVPFLLALMRKHCSRL